MPGSIGELWLVAGVAAWLVGAAWAAADARRRVASRLVPPGVGAACLAVPLAGPLLWVLVRPPQTRAARYEADLRLRFLEQFAPADLGERDEPEPGSAEPEPAAALRPEPAAAAV